MGPRSDDHATTTEARPRMLFVSELRAHRGRAGTTIPGGHLRRYGMYSKHFDMAWTLTARNDTGFHRAPLPDDIDVVWLPSFGSAGGWLRSLPSQVRTLWQETRRHDAVLVNVPSPPALPALAVARLRGRPAFALFLSRWVQLRRHPERTFRGQQLAMTLLTQLSVLLSTRTYTAGDALIYEIWRPLRRRTLPTTFPAVDEADIAAPDALAERELGRPVVLFTVARFLATKRLDAVVLTVGELRRRGRDARAVLVGDGVERATIQRLVAEQGLDHAIDLPGWVDDWDRLREAYREASVFVFASEDEGLPLVIMEAMAMGLPVVTTPVGGLATWLKHERDALVVTRPDPVELADAVERVADDHQLRRRLQACGIDHVRAHTREAWLAWFVGEVDRVLQNQRRGTARR